MAPFTKTIIMSIMQVDSWGGLFTGDAQIISGDICITNISKIVTITGGF